MSDNEGWEDDDMADLFSFGNEGGSPPSNPTADSTEAPPAPVVEKIETAPEPASPERERVLSSDSILDMLDGETGSETLVLGDSSAPKVPMQEQDAQDILNWLDEEDTSAAVVSESSEVVVTEKTVATDTKGDVQVTEETTKPPALTLASAESSQASTETAPADNRTTAEPQPTIVDLPPPKPPSPIHFDSLEEALDSSESTMDHLRALFVDGGMKVAPERRAELWCRTVCGKTIEQVESSSLAESFLDWKQMANIEQGDDARSVYIRKEAGILAERIVAGSSKMTLEEAKRALCEVLLFYYQSSSGDSQEVDPLLPPVACVILSAGVSAAATTVILTRIMPSFMPLLALAQDDRWEAAKSLHKQFYLLACYHLPLLVFHLDRYAPGWYWPKTLGVKGGDESVTEMGRNLEAHGVVPQSWLISHLAGECGGTLMNPVWLLSLWDLILTSSNNSLRFFLSLAVLEKASNTLLMLTGDDLLNELKRIMEFKEGTTPEGFAIVAEEETSETEAGDFVQEWCDRARSLWEATPRSVVSQLRTAEDESVKTALMQRQKKAEEELQARLEAEAKAHREAAEAEKERKAEEARLRLSRARLVAYYRTHNPEKEGNIDKIMEVYKGRLDVLDMKLKSKYGVSFKPALKPKSAAKSNPTQKLLSTMNQGLNSRRSAEKSTEDSEPKPGDPDHQVAVKVLATEVLPVICWSKEAASSRGVTALARGRYNDEYRLPLKFYLIDSRPEATAEEQGRFPTAVVVSPEALLDPDRIQQHEEMFESLRGAVHICIMGEGFSAVPHLYNQKLTPKLQHYIDEDESRTSLCALFFIKKGFPFVSVLDGGFVQAHAWLCREGPNRHLDVSSVLVDYDENSFFGRLEKSYRTQQELANASVGEKTQHALQSFLDSSMTTLTRTARLVEHAAAEAAAEMEAEYSSKSVVPKILPEKEVEEEESFVGSPVNADDTGDEEQSEPTKESEGNFVSRFAGKLNKKSEKDAAVSKENGGADAKEQAAEDSEPKFKIPFGGLKAAGGTEGGDAGNTPVFRNPFAARRSVVPEKEQDEDKKVEEKTEGTKEAQQVEDPDLVDVTIAPTADSNKPGTFSRLARAASSSIQKVGEHQNAAQNSLKRNPFARFGSAKPVEKKPEADNKKPMNRFSGINMNNMNQLRKNTISSLRAKAAADRAASEEAELVEESISFDHASTATAAPTDAAADIEAKETTKEDAVVEKV